MITDKIKSDFLHPFTLDFVATIDTVAREMKQWGLSVDDVLEITEDHFKGIVEKSENNAAVRKKQRPETGTGCPSCGSDVYITKVNVSRCTNVGGGFKTSVQCSDEHCRWSELSKKTVKEIIENGL